MIGAARGVHGGRPVAEAAPGPIHQSRRGEEIPIAWSRGCIGEA